jgi:hypothetical protein
MAIHLSENDLARAKLKVSDDGTALVPINTTNEVAILSKPPTVAVMPGTESAVLRPTEPDAEWSLSELGNYAKERLTSVTTSIFQAGRALKLAHDQFTKKRAWGKWLKQQGIPRTSAWEAIELFEQAKTEDAVANLTRVQALKKFGIRKTRTAKVRAQAAPAQAESGQPPTVPMVPSLPATQESLLCFLANVKKLLEDRYQHTETVDWTNEDLAGCKEVAWEIMAATEQWINEVDDHAFKQAS